MKLQARGVALFTGETTSVELSSTTGPTSLWTAAGGGGLSTWSRSPAFQTTALEHPSGAKVACVEHLFAALAAFGAHEGVSIFVRGTELPILDGGAARWCALLAELTIPVSAPLLEVGRDGEIETGGSTYRFSRAAGCEISVELDLSGAGSFADTLETRASWDGTRASFIGAIADARTFVLERDLEMLAAKSAAYAPPESVVVIGSHAARSQGRPFRKDEPARHKLLDFMGDLFVWGGPPRGRIDARRSGHARNHEALRLALERGIVRRI